MARSKEGPVAKIFDWLVSIVAAILFEQAFGFTGIIASIVIAIIAGSFIGLVFHILVHGDARELRQLRKQHRKRISR